MKVHITITPETEHESMLIEKDLVETTLLEFAAVGIKMIYSDKKP